MHIRVHGYILMMQNQPEISFRHRGLKIPKGFFLLDIDHKDISDPFAQLMLSRFSSYAEVSPSDKGIHIIGQCDITKLPVHFDDRRKSLVLDSEYYQKRSDIGLELYIGDITNR